MSKIAKKCLLALSAALLAVCIILPVAFSLAEESDGVKNLPGNLTSETVNELFVGTQLDFQESYIVKDGERLETSCEMTRPDGSVLATKKILLEEMGVYRIALFGFHSSGAYAEYVYNIYACKDTFSFSGSRSSSEYGEHKNEKGLFGQIVTLYEGDTATYNKVIDLSDYSSSDVVFEWIPIASAIGAGDFDYVEFTFTDLYDANNYFKVGGTYHHSYKETYFKAGATDQVLSGWYAAGGWVHIGNEWGANAGVSFYNTPRYASKPSGDSMRLKYDNGKKTVNVGDAFVIDLDDPKYFSNLWQGFTTGECLMSVQCGSYISDNPAKFMFTSICGEKMTGQPVKDNDPPEIQVNLDGNEAESMPFARVNKPYPVPTTKAYDTYNGEIKVEVKVWLNYGNTAASTVNIDGGTFLPTRATVYTIEYTAEDYSGNKAVVTLRITASSDVQDVQLSLSEDQPTEYFLGQKLIPQSYKVSGGTGRYDTQIIIVSPSGERTSYDKKKGFIATQKGIYVVEYSATDFIGQTGKASYEVKVGQAGVPVFYEKAELPKYFIAGAKYTLPVPEAFDYTSGEANNAQVGIRVTDKDGTRVLKDREYIPQVGQSGDKVKIIYFAVNAQGEGRSMEYTVPVIEVGTPEKLNTAAYFVGTASAEYRNSGERFVLVARKSGDYAEYILPVISNGFTMELKTYGAHDTIGGFTLEFTDFLDETSKITVQFIKQRTGSLLLINGVQYETDESVAGDTFSFGYREFNRRLKVGNMNYTVGSFNGFASGKMYVKVTFNDVTGEYPMEVVNINTQIFNTDIDEIKPKISVLGEYAGIKENGSVVTVYKAVACDMFDPCVTAYVTVKDPNGNIMTATDGTRLENADIGKDYQIVLNGFGYYRVSYYTEDWNANVERNFIYQFIVEDTVSPVIEVETKDVKAKVGEGVLLPQAVVTDNYTSSDKILISVFVVNDKGYVERIDKQSAGYVFTPPVAGEYTVRYYAQDENGNAALAQVRLIVS